MKKIGIIVQARTGSSRLPGKMVLPFHGQDTVLGLLIDRLKIAAGDAPVVVATSCKEGDDAIGQLCMTKGIGCFRGSETDVLSRFVGASSKYGFTHVVRICADNLFLDMESLKTLLVEMQRREFDYLSYSANNTPAILTHHGLWAMEAVSVKALDWVNRNVAEPLFHEHVTNYFYTHAGEFDVQFMPIVSPIAANRRLRLTIDTHQDFEMMQQLYSELPEITPESIVAALDRHPDFYEVMEQVINQNRKS